MDTRRLILLMIFSFSLVMLWDAWQKFQHPRAPAAPVAQIPAPQSLPVNASSAPGVPVANPTTNAPAKDERVAVETDLIHADLSALGGNIVALDLSKYRSTVDPKQNFSLFGEAHHYAAQSGLIGEGMPNHRSAFRFLPGPRELATGDQFEVRLEADGPPGVKVHKIYTFHRGSYRIDVRFELQGETVPDAFAYFQLQRDAKAPDGESRMVSTFTGPAVFTDQDKYQKIKFDDLRAGKAKFATKADNGWLAMVQHYFVASWVPAPQTPREYYMRALEDPLYAAGVIVPIVKSGDGKAGATMTLYAGPQDQAKLKQIAPGLDLVVDYGWLHLIAAPIFWLLDFIHGFVGNWGWAIVVLTVLIKLVFFPLSAASYKSMARMRQVTPRLMALKERYGDDRQKLNQEMMDLYRKEKINPLGGCLPILVQIPVFIALYWVLLGAVEMRGAEWILWIKDLSSEDPYYILPVIMVVSMLVQTKLNPTPPDPIQAKVMMAMPFIFGAMFFFFPSGLVLYWVVNNVLSIAQQWQITRMIDGGRPAAAK